MKTTVSAAGGAVLKIDRGAVMTRAWAIFRETYLYPQIKFADIGRRCFAWALRQAWIEAREAARVAALSPVAKAERIETLEYLIAYMPVSSTADRSGKQPSAPTATKSANSKRPERRAAAHPPDHRNPHA